MLKVFPKQCNIIFLQFYSLYHIENIEKNNVDGIGRWLKP